MQQGLTRGFLSHCAAGLDFGALRGCDRVGVYVGACGSEVHGQWLSDIAAITGWVAAQPDPRPALHACSPHNFMHVGSTVTCL